MVEYEGWMQQRKSHIAGYYAAMQFSASRNKETIEIAYLGNLDFTNNFFL